VNYRLFFAVTVLLFFVSKNLFAQEKFEPGYIINTQNDTIRGFVDYRNWSKNPEEIGFKTSFQGESKFYGLKDILGFYVHDEHYEKAIVKVDVSPYKSNQLSESPVPQIQIDTVFLMAVVNGPKSLYYLKDKSDKTHLYIMKGKDFELLAFYQYKLVRADQSGIITVDGFKQQLQEYLGNCPSTDSGLRTLSYSKNRVAKLFNHFYEACDSSNPVYVQKKEKVLLQTGILAGLSATKIKFSGINHPYLTEPSLALSKQAAAGVFLNLVFPRTQRKLSLYNDLIFTSMKVRSHSEEHTSADDYSFSDVTLKYGYLKLTNMVRYKLVSKESFDFFVNAGISNGLLISETNSRRKETYFFSNQGNVTSEKALKEVRKHEEALSIGLGGVIRKYSLELRYEMANGMSAYTSLKSPVKRAYVLFGYRF